MLITMHPSNIQTKFLYEEEGSNIMHKCYLFTKVNFSFFTFFVLVRDFFIHQLNPIRPGFNLRNLNCCLTSKLCVCFQKYKLTSHEKKNWSKFKKVSEILRFENVMDLRFRLDLTHKNGPNSLNFLDTGLIF